MVKNEAEKPFPGRFDTLRAGIEILVAGCHCKQITENPITKNFKE